MGAVNRHINAPRAQVYHALLDAQAVAQWMVPQGMTSQVHEFDAREGGATDWSEAALRVPLASARDARAGDARRSPAPA